MAPTPEQHTEMKQLGDQIYALELQKLDIGKQAILLSRKLKKLRYAAYGSGIIYGEVEEC